MRYISSVALTLLLLPLSKTLLTHSASPDSFQTRLWISLCSHTSAHCVLLQRWRAAVEMFKADLFGVFHSCQINGNLLQSLVACVMEGFMVADKQHWIFPQDLWIGFGIYCSSLENGTDTALNVAATIHARPLCAEIFIFILQRKCVFFFVSAVSILQKGKASLIQTADSVCFPIDSQSQAFPLCDIPLCGERASPWVQEHAFQTAYMKISSEPRHAKSRIVSSNTLSLP